MLCFHRAIQRRPGCCQTNANQSPLPLPDRFVADLDAPLVQEILDIAQRQREADVEHHRQANDLGARFEVAKRGALGHPARLAGRPTPLQEKFL